MDVECYIFYVYIKSTITLIRHLVDFFRTNKLPPLLTAMVLQAICLSNNVAKSQYY